MEEPPPNRPIALVQLRRKFRLFIREPFSVLERIHVRAQASPPLMAGKLAEEAGKVRQEFLPRP